MLTAMLPIPWVVVAGMFERAMTIPGNPTAALAMATELFADPE